MAEISLAGPRRRSRIVSLARNLQRRVSFLLMSRPRCLVEGSHVDPNRFPALLEISAGIGTVSTYTLHLSQGAQLGPRILHRALESAARCNCLVRMGIVEYLVRDLVLDVNPMETEGNMPRATCPITGRHRCVMQPVPRAIMKRLRASFLSACGSLHQIVLGCMTPLARRDIPGSLD